MNEISAVVVVCWTALWVKSPVAALMVYVALATADVVEPVSVPMALIVVVVATLMAPE